jgi:hypothetical protein
MEMIFEALYRRTRRRRIKGLIEHVHRHTIRVALTVAVLTLGGAVVFYAADLAGIAWGLVSAGCGALGLRLGIGRP